MAINNTEVEQRVAILKRLKQLLFGQREKFRSYLDLLERQETDIINNDSEKLTAHMELEKSIVMEISSFQKVIDPLEDMYRMAYPTHETEIPAIKESLSKIREGVLERNQHNQELLRTSMGEMRQKISDLRSIRKLTTPILSEPVPTLIDTTA
jgi:hypothetical protein